MSKFKKISSVIILLHSLWEMFIILLGASV